MKLSYGNGATCELPAADVTWVRANAVNTIVDQDVAAAIQTAFASPLDYPDLASATVPGDTVAIALEFEVPQLLPIIAGTLTALERAGVERTSITILLAPEYAGDHDRQQAMRDLVGGDVKLVLHDLEVEDQLALLGVTDANRPLRLNRVLCDADLVIPIGSMRANNLNGESAEIFPTFSDRETRGRFHAPGSQETSAAQQKLAAEVQECAWMLGVGLAIQVVPGPAGSVAGVYCGTLEGATRAARQAYEQVWSTAVDGRADLVVASIIGDDTQQTWRNLSRALLAADELLAPGGAIAICSEIATRPGASGKRLRDAADLVDTERKLLKDEFPDSVAALRLCRSLQRGTVYLKSRLDGAVVERFGLAPIESDHEIERLVQTYRRCLVLEEAQHLLPALAN